MIIILEGFPFVMYVALLLKQSLPIVCLNVFSSALQFMYEGFQMHQRTVSKYFSSLKNCIDLLGHTCGLIWCFGFLVEYQKIKGDLVENSEDLTKLLEEILT